MNQKKPSSLARILSYAGGHKNLTILGCILSALSAVLGLAPYLCVWLVARSVLSAWPCLDGAGNLIDGYTSYLLAKAHGLDSVPVRYGRRQIVRASHRKGGKLYAWELPGLLVGRVSVGEKLVVRTSRGLRTVTVAEVEEYAGQEPEPLRMAIRKPRARREAA